MIMRPDEIAGQSEIERDQRFRSNVGKGIGTAATIAGGVAAASTAKILPWLSSYIPVDLAMKGISKVSPKLGDFLKRGQAAGLNIEEGIQYLRDQAPKQEKVAKENRNIIEQYSPELHQFILGEIKLGRNAMQAGALASADKKRFKKIIDKITKDHKTPWSAILQTVYGSGETQQKSPNPPEQPQQTQSNDKWGDIKQGLMDMLNS